MSEHLELCILAAGKGSRMKSNKPKVLQELAGKPLISHLLETGKSLKPKKIHLVIGAGGEQIQTRFSDSGLNFVEQAEQLGTGHAVQQLIPYLNGGRVLILLGDAPLVSKDSLERLIAEDCDLGVLSVDHPNPFNYGRILRDETGVQAIIEERDANDEIKTISEINTGVMVADATQLVGWLTQLSAENDQGEFLLTDIVSIARSEGRRVVAIKAKDHREVQGVNTFAQLAELEQYYQAMAASQLLNDGVQIVDPARFTLRGELVAGQDVFIDVNCIIEGKVKLGDGVRIGANTVIKDATIGPGSVIKPFSHVEGATMESDCAAGPFARLRPGTYFEDNVAVGNFVEVKKSRLGVGSKASHLSYIGDAVLGQSVNIGAGTITCNYDGVNKHVTNIEDGVFVGTNTSLVAPVTLGEWSTIAAGSTITSNVPARSLGVGRGKQRNIEGWKGPRD